MVSKISGLIHWVFRSPDEDRLASEIARAWVDLDHRIHIAGHHELTRPWARAACGLLLQSRNCLAARDLQQGWTALLSAQRMMLTSFHDPGEIQRVAIALRREAEKVSDWRARAIEDLICGQDGNLLEDLSNEERRMRVVDAAAIRDGHYHNNAFKIRLRRRHLSHLFMVLSLSLVLCLVLSYFSVLPPILASTKQVTTVLLFGVLGAAVSVAHGLLKANISAKIPDQQIGSFVIWMRPAVGAAAALIAYVLLQANFFNLDTTSAPLVIVVAFAAGFSERFIVGAIERIAQTTAAPG